MRKQSTSSLPDTPLHTIQGGCTVEENPGIEKPPNLEPGGIREGPTARWAWITRPELVGHMSCSRKFDSQELWDRPENWPLPESSAPSAKIESQKSTKYRTPWNSEPNGDSVVVYQRPNGHEGVQWSSAPACATSGLRRSINMKTVKETANNEPQESHKNCWTNEMIPGVLFNLIWKNRLLLMWDGDTSVKSNRSRSVSEIVLVADVDESYRFIDGQIRANQD